VRPPVLTGRHLSAGLRGCQAAQWHGRCGAPPPRAIHASARLRMPPHASARCHQCASPACRQAKAIIYWPASTYPSAAPSTAPRDDRTGDGGVSVVATRHLAATHTPVLRAAIATGCLSWVVAAVFSRRLPRRSRQHATLRSAGLHRLPQPAFTGRQQGCGIYGLLCSQFG
jgi:hypothetical protein